jgi:hypothetical protein
MADVADGSVASWVQAGGVGLFAAAVLWQLRDLKPIFKAVGETLTRVETTLAALLERERTRGERLAAQDALRRGRLATLEGREETWEDEPTGAAEVPVLPPRRTPPRGAPVVGGGYGPTKPRGGNG